ncbi:hypothetical protein B0H14DRAFT_2463681 [Mycena olivaceomarginata]|nr:hypothetical protein B0H14DRAFT_2463681 [Mycena olivaceomarginata]
MQFVTPQGQSSSTFKPPPVDGSLLIPDVLEYNAQHSPQHPLFVYAEGDRTVKTITWSQAVKAFRQVAHITRMGVPVAEGESAAPVVAILALTDQITYLSMIAGVILAGYLPFPLSPRNSDAAVAHLLRSTSCTHIFVGADPSMQKLAGAAHSRLLDLGGDLKIMPLPTFKDIFEPSSTPQALLPIRTAKLEDPIVIMHSSGSTAFPKSIPLSHHMFWESGLIPSYGEVDICGEILSVHAAPMFHMLGLINFPYVAYTGLVLSGFSPVVPITAPTPDRVFEAAIASNSTLLICAPTYLESWAREPARVRAMKKFITVIFGGGPLQRIAGDELVKNGVNVSHLYGLTETSTLSMYIPKSVPKDGWDYFPLSPHLNPALVPLKENPGVYQVYVKKCATHTPAVLDTIIDGVPAFNTKDLILRHPTNPNLWKIFGRQDDQIMHSNGEKTNPGPIEKILLENPAIKYAIMFGRGNFHAGVMVFPEDPVDPMDPQQVADFRRKIWPTVEQANHFAPTHSRIFKEMILVANPSKPVELTAKGTPRRQAVLDAYAEEIREMYETVEESFQKHLATPMEWTASSSLEFVRKIVGEVMVEVPQDDDDIFQHGCDSLQATWIRNSIHYASMASQKIDPQAIPTNFVYSHSTIRLLAEMLTKLAAGGTSDAGDISRRADAMRAMVHKYTQGFPQHVPTEEAPQDQAILLTGTTGALGSHILAHLLTLREFSAIYALNRPSTDLRERQCQSFQRSGIDPCLLDSPKLKLLGGDLNAPRFALSQEDFDALGNNVTLIVHNAWQVNFNVALASMEPLVAGTRHLIDFALLSPRPSPARILFVSTAGVFRNVDESNTALERSIPDPRVSIGLGYTESKWVAEQVLETAAQTTALSPVIVRPGQLSGATNGAWNPSEWFPVLLRSSQVLGHLPTISGQISWIPVHNAAEVLVEMRDSQERYLHITHPHPVPMEHILSPLSELLNLPLVPYSVWLESLETASEQESGASVNPAVRLIDFFRFYREVGPEEEAFFPVLLSNTAAINVAHSLASVAPLKRQDVEGWAAYLLQGDYLS